MTVADKVFSRRVGLAPGDTQNAAARWAEVMRYPRDLSDEAALVAADAYAAEHDGDIEAVREAFTTAARTALVARWRKDSEAGIYSLDCGDRDAVVWLGPSLKSGGGWSVEERGTGRRLAAGEHEGRDLRTLMAVAEAAARDVP